MHKEGKECCFLCQQLSSCFCQWPEQRPQYILGTILETSADQGHCKGWCEAEVQRGHLIFSSQKQGMVPVLCVLPSAWLAPGSFLSHGAGKCCTQGEVKVGTTGSLCASCLAWFYDSHCSTPLREAAGRNNDPEITLEVISLKVVTTVVAFSEMPGTPLGGKQMALQAHGGHHSGLDGSFFLQPPNMVWPWAASALQGGKGDLSVCCGSRSSVQRTGALSCSFS